MALTRIGLTELVEVQDQHPDTIALQEAIKRIEVPCLEAVPTVVEHLHLARQEPIAEHAQVHQEHLLIEVQAVEPKAVAATEVLAIAQEAVEATGLQALALEVQVVLIGLQVLVQEVQVVL